MKSLLFVGGIALSALVGAATAIAYLNYVAPRPTESVKAAPRSTESVKVAVQPVTITESREQRIAEVEKVNTIPWRTFLATTPASGGTFRCMIHIDNYYNYNFLESQCTHYSIQIYDLSGQPQCHGYIPKFSSLGDNIFAVLKDGKTHPATLTILNSRSGNSSIAEIIEVKDIGNNWGLK